jgi:hypothetical protein
MNSHGSGSFYEMDWHTIIDFGTIALAAMAFLSRSFDKSLSIREHEEFRRSIGDQLNRIREDFHREFDRIIRRIEVLEQTRPTTGELEARLRPKES